MTNQRHPHVFEKLFAQWRHNQDAELEQAAVRLVLGGFIILYLLLSGGDVTNLYGYFAGFLGAAAYLIAHVRAHPGHFPWRRYAGQIVDLGSISVVLYLGDQVGAVGFGIYMWVIIGNGCRFGLQYLVSATGIAAVLFAWIALNHPYWQANASLAVGLWVMQIAVPAYLSSMLHRLDLANQRLDHLSRHDELTGLLNRRAFEERLDDEFARLQRLPSDMGLAIVDIDHFKSVNDNYGHVTGDTVIRHVTRELVNACRECDVSGRYGGEEFVFLLPGLAHGSIEQVVERLRAAVEAAPLVERGMVICATVSIGAACWHPGYAASKDWVRDADAALYAAKARGRNRLVLAPACNLHCAT